MKHILANALQKMLNRYLSLDPESIYRLQKLEGKKILLHLTGLPFPLQMIFTENTIYIKTQDFLPTDTTISSTPLSLMHMALSKNRQRFFAEEVVLEGNVEVGQEIIALFDELEIDWEELLSKITGDMGAYHLGRVARKFKRWRQGVNASLAQNINEYIHEEIKLFPPREALEDFFQEIDKIRLDVDRAEARIMRLMHFQEDKE